MNEGLDKGGIKVTGREKIELRQKGGERMPVVKVLELVGESKRDWQDAVANAVAEASRTIKNISGVEVYNWTANVEAGRIVEYKADVKVAYVSDQAQI